MVFITTTAEPLSAFLMTISGLSQRVLSPDLCSFVRLSGLPGFILLFNRPFLNACLKVFKEMWVLVGFQVLSFLKGACNVLHGFSFSSRLSDKN